METKRQQQKTPITKNSDLDLDAFLHNVTNFPIKDINKQFIFNLDDTYDVKFSLTGFLDFNPITNYFYKSRVFSCVNGMILDITFKFLAGHNMRLTFDYFYAPRKKKHRPFNLSYLMWELNLHDIHNIEYYIDFLFSFFFFTILFFSFFYFFLAILILFLGILLLFFATNYLFRRSGGSF
jgi:hypothetical protein